MSLTPKDIENIAHLARLQVTAQELPVYVDSLSRIMNFVEQLGAADTGSVEPMAHPLAGQVQRLREAARLAAEGGYDFFTTTLTISPLKNAQLLNAIGAELGEKYGIPWLYSDFKKREGYKRSIILSKEYDLYRQNYCGCVFSKRDSMQRKN